MPQHARSDRPQEFCSLECYHGFHKPIASLPPLPRGFGDWLAGFTDGEGCFQMVVRHKDRVYLAFSISLRADDSDVLAYIQQTLQIGRTFTHTHKEGNGNIALKWQVSSASECALLVELFDRYSLRAKKLREFRIWAAAVREKLKGVAQDKDRLLQLRRELIDARAWATNKGRLVYQYRFTEGRTKSLGLQTPWVEEEVAEYVT